MTEQRQYSRYAQKQAGVHNKFYEVRVEELEDGRASLLFVYGRIGTEGRTLDQGTIYSFEAARQSANTQFLKKLGKGYVEVSAMQALAAASQDPKERKLEGFPPVKISIPEFNAGKSDERCRKFCQKYLDKVNLIRTSYYEMDEGEYLKQMCALLKSYWREWRRIETSKTHANLTNCPQAQIAIRTFSMALTAARQPNPSFSHEIMTVTW